MNALRGVGDRPLAIATPSPESGMPLLKADAGSYLNSCVLVNNGAACHLAEPLQNLGVRCQGAHIPKRTIALMKISKHAANGITSGGTNQDDHDVSRVPVLA